MPSESQRVSCPSCHVENDTAATACASCGTTLVQAAPAGFVVTVDLRPGAVFHSRWEIQAPLGRGGMGTVYKAYDRTLDETVAIKVLRPDFAQDPGMAQRFKSEIKLARKVRHKNVCTIHDYGEDQGLLFISMELIEGVDLKHILKERGALPAEQAYDVAIQVAEGLQAVHDAGIVHRDLKTPNIMLDGQGVTRLMDFGVAKRLGEGTLTATGQIVGTPEYMSPEQAQGHKIDYRSDIYALGIVTYEIFTGRVPFRGETPISTILKHLNEPPPLDGPQAARIPQVARTVLRTALAKDPKDRYATATAMAEALRDARSPSRRQQPIPTEVLVAPTVKAPRSRAETPAPPPKGRLPMALVAGAVVVAGAVTLLLWSRSQGTSEPSPEPTPTATIAAPPVTYPQVLATPMIPAADEPTGPPDRSDAAAGATPRPATPSPRPTPRPSPTLGATPVPPPSTLAAVATRTEATAAPAGFLLVAVKPWATVSVDGKALGETPIEAVPLAPGTHAVRVVNPAYEVLERQVLIRSGESQKLVVDLTTQGVRKKD